MKRFSITVLIFIILFVSINYVVFLYYEDKAFKCETISPYNRINRIYSLKNVNADVIIVGNSRAEGSYNDTILSDILRQKCLNIGWSGYPFNYQYYVMLKTYLEQNTRPQYIIQEIGPWAFLDYVNPKYTIEMMPYLDRDGFHFLESICPEITKWDRFRLFRYSGKFGEIMNEIKYFDGKMKKHKGQQSGYQRNYLKHKYSLECDSDIIALFKQYVNECSKDSIKLIFICSPIHIDEGSSYFDMKGFWNIFNGIAKSHNIPVLNYQDLYGNDTTYFMNSMHLNKYGRDCYTKTVAHDLDSLGIIEQTKNTERKIR